MLIVLAVHAVVALACAAAGARLGRRTFTLAALAPASTVALCAWSGPRLLGGEVVTQDLRWVESLSLDLGLRADAFSMLFLLLVGGVGILVMAYAAHYFAERPDLGRVAALLVAFAGSMVGIVVADNLLALVTFWELTSVTSYLLIGFEDRSADARSSARRALLTTGTGGLALLGGVVVLGQAAGTYSLSAIVADPPDGTPVSFALGLVLLGVLTKSAQVPFHGWLPAAMAAPTPVSAYLHSATMVKAGVYLVARLAPAFAPLVGWWRPVVVGIGVATMLVGGVRALRQHDLKLVLAYGTVSQLGFLVALFGAGVPELTAAGAAVLLAHGLYKSLLFMVVGIVDRQTGTRDLRSLTGVGRRMPAVLVTATVGIASMAGVPLLFGFVAKEAAIDGLLDVDLGAVGVPAAIGVVAGSALTVAYGTRFLWGAFATKAVGSGRHAVGPDVAPPGRALVGPASSLAALTVVLGIAVPLADGLVAPAATALDALAADEHLRLWHGLTPALGLSGVALAAGVGLFLLVLVTTTPVPIALPHRSGADGAYDRTVAGLEALARRSTASFQSGSLPVYLTCILVTIAAVPGSVLLGRTAPGAGYVLAESWLQAVVAVVVVGAGAAVVFANRRMTAVVLLGAVGYGTAVLFVIQGAPDLALTQMMVETLSLVIFALVLRHLPARFEKRRRPVGTALRVAISLLVGTFVAGALLVSSGARTADPVSEEQLAGSRPLGGGDNVVNVILVDMRGFDTVGEITVLAVAALGVAGLVAAGRRPRDGEAGPPGPVSGGEAVPAAGPR